jgi:hypothetical protein
MQALDLLRLQRDRRIFPTKGDVGMVTFGFRQITSPFYESKRLCKILKLESSLDPPIVVPGSPLGCVATIGVYLVFSERGKPPRQGVQDLPRRDFGCDDMRPSERRSSCELAQPRFSLVKQFLSMRDEFL